MCDPAGNNELKQVRVSDALLEEHSDTRTDLHSVICCSGQHNICRDPDHRRLAICSIICGLSCIGFVSLIYSVKSRETRKTLQNEGQTQKSLKVKEYSRKALKWGVASIVAWVVLIFIFPLLVGLLSYIMTFID